MITVKQIIRSQKSGFRAQKIVIYKENSIFRTKNNYLAQKNVQIHDFEQKFVIKSKKSRFRTKILILNRTNRKFEPKTNIQSQK